MCPLHFSPGGAYMVLIDVPIIQAATKLCNARLIRIDNNRGEHKALIANESPEKLCQSTDFYIHMI